MQVTIIVQERIDLLIPLAEVQIAAEVQRLEVAPVEVTLLMEDRQAQVEVVLMADHQDRVEALLLMEGHLLAQEAVAQ